MRNLASTIVVAALLAAGCAVALPFGGDHHLKAEIESSDEIRSMLPQAVPPGYMLDTYSALVDPNDNLVMLESQYHDPDGETIVGICVAGQRVHEIAEGCVGDGPSRVVARDSAELTVAVACWSDECDTNLEQWLELFGTSTPSPDEAVSALGLDW